MPRCRSHPQFFEGAVDDTLTQIPIGHSIRAGPADHRGTKSMSRWSLSLLHDLGRCFLGAVLVPSCIPTAAVSQAPAANPKSSEVPAAEYQTRQRVLHLLELDADVQT